MIRFFTFSSVVALSACGAVNQNSETHRFGDEHLREIQLTAKDKTKIEVNYIRDDSYTSIGIKDARDFSVTVKLSQFHINPVISARFLEKCESPEYQSSEKYDVILNTNSTGTSASAFLHSLSHRMISKSQSLKCSLTLKVFVNGKALVDPVGDKEEFLLDDKNAVHGRERETANVTRCSDYNGNLFIVTNLGDSFALDYVRTPVKEDLKAVRQQVRIHGASETRIKRFGTSPERGRTWFWGRDEFVRMTVAGGLGAESGEVVFTKGMTLPSGEKLAPNSKIEFTECRFSSEYLSEVL